MHALNSRILLLDITPAQSKLIRWKPFANYLALVGPQEELEAAETELKKFATSLQAQVGDIMPTNSQLSTAPVQIAQAALHAWTLVTPTESTQA
jgi:hypothetical protein